MSYTFVIGDIHGRFDLLEKAMDQIEDYSNSGKVIFLGDLVDRGFQSNEVIQMIKDGPSDPTSWEWIVLCGNHDDMMIQGYYDDYHAGHWIGNGGGSTIASYTNDYGNFTMESHVEWLKTLPYYYEDRLRYYVHGGLESNKTPQDSNPEILMWLRYGELEMGYRHQSGKHLVHGHTPVESGPITYVGRTNMDTLAYYNGRLVVGVFDDLTEGTFVDIIEIQGPAWEEYSQLYKEGKL